MTPDRRAAIQRLVTLAYRGLFQALKRQGLTERMKRFPAVRALEGAIASRLKSDVADIHGHRMYLDARDSLRLSIHGTYEPFETELVRSEVGAGDTVLDIGANIGYYTLLFARLVGEKGRVFAFEPDPENFALLKKNVEENGYGNVILIQKAVSDENAQARLFLSAENAGDHRMHDPGDGRPYIDVDVVRLDDYLKGDAGQIDLVKIDVQGAEAGVLRGMLDLLRRNESVKIVTEFWPREIEESGHDHAAVLDKLFELGFTLYRIDEQRQELLETNASELQGSYTPENGKFTNLLCKRDSQPARRS